MVQRAGKKVAGKVRPRGAQGSIELNINSSLCFGKNSQPLAGNVERLNTGHYASHASVVVLLFTRSEASIVFEFYSSGKQKPQNFQHHKNGRQEIAACSVLKGQYWVFNKV